MPQQNIAPAAAAVDIEALVKQIIPKLPASAGSAVYTVAPLVAIKKKFLEEAKNKILESIKKLDDQQKKMLKWIEAFGKQTVKNQLFEHCFGKSATAGNTYTALARKITEMKQAEVIRVDTNQRIFPFLRDAITAAVSSYDASSAEIENVYNHILNDLL